MSRIWRSHMLKNILAECCADLNDCECTTDNLIAHCKKYSANLFETLLSHNFLTLETKIEKTANEYNDDPEMYFAIYSALFNKVLFKAFDEELIEYFKISDRCKELYKTFTHLFNNYSCDFLNNLDSSEYIEIVKKLTTKSNFTDIVKLHNKQEKPDISFVPVMIDENKFHGMYEDYMQTLSDFSDYVRNKLKTNPNYSNCISDEYTRKASITSSAKVLFIKHKSDIVGFVCLIEYPLMSFHNCTFAIDQFYILHEYRNTGIAEEAVKRIFKMYGGKGALGVLVKNIRARKFWNKMLSKYTKCYDAFQDKTDNEAYYYIFLL